MSAFENNPESMLARLGPKGREIAEKFLLNQIQDEMLSPEEREFRQTKKERDELKAEKEAALKKQQDEAREREEFQYAQTFQKTIIDALDQSGMPKTALNVRRLADLMSKNLELGLDLSPKELAEEWAKERASNNQAEIKEMTAEQFIKLYGADMAKKLRLHSLKELQEKQGMVFQGGKKIESSGPKVTESRPTSLEEYMEAARKRARG